MTWRTLAVSTAFAAFLIAALWSIVRPTYFEIDDAAIRLTIAGEDLPGEPPTSHLVFTHEALARAAVAVQRNVPRTPVWDVILTAGLVAGIGALIALVWCALAANFWARCAALAVLLAAVAPFAMGLQFTISAVVCAGAGTILAIYELLSTRPRRSIVFVAAIEILFGYLIRPMAAEGGVLVLLACLGPVAFARTPRWVRLRRLALLGLLVVSSFAALDFADQALYSKEGGWATYYASTWQFVNLIDWNGAARDAHLDAIRAAAGWSENDWKMLWLGWGLTDPKTFGPEPIARGFEVLRHGSSQAERARAAWDAIDLDSTIKLVETLSIVMPLTFVLAIGIGNRHALLLTAIILIEFAIICSILDAGFKELPFRLLAPLQACLVGMMILGISEHLRPPGWGTGVTTALALALLAQQASASIHQARAEIEHAHAIELQMQEVLKLNPSYVVLHGDAFPAGHWWRPFHQPPVRFPMIRLGGNNGNPLLQDFLGRTGRTRLLAAICTDPSMVVIADPRRLDLVTAYMSEHEARAVTWENVFDGSFRAWRCH